MTDISCDHCQHEIPLDWRHCPHCCFGLQCPNVRRAREAEEKAALTARYEAAIQDANTQGCSTVVHEFEQVAVSAKIVMGTTMSKLLPIVNRSRDLFATYYDLMDLKFYSTANGQIDWNKRRPQAEIELLGTHKHIDKLHYACLSADGQSLPHYGECTVRLSERMVAHRVSLYTENTAVAYHRNHGFPIGNRAEWSDRGLLCVAKLAGKLNSSTKSAEFPEILMQAGPTGVEDEFVEVQILGEMTFRTFESLEIRTNNSQKRSAPKRPRVHRGTKDQLLIEDYAEQNGVPCELV